MAKAPRESFTVPEDPATTGDIAMVGGHDEGPDLDIEPSDNKADWDLPKGEPKPKAEDADFDQEDSRLAYEDTAEGPPEERGSQSRRARRNARRREYMDQQTNEINVLKQHLNALGGVVERLTTGQAGLAINSIDGQINSLEQALRMADQELADAVATNNGAKYAEVNKLRDEVVGRLWQTKGQRDQMARGAQAAYQQPRQQQSPQQQQPQADPAVTEMVADRFDRFQGRYPWFDPDSADADCNIVRAIDAELVTQGYQRHTPVFWTMLEQKMSRYGMTPERGGGKDPDDDEGDDERPARRVNGNGALLGRDVDVPVRRAGPPTGSGRSTRTATGGFALSEWQRDTLRDEGLLEENLGDADVAKRDRIIAKWRKGADSLRRGRMN